MQIFSQKALERLHRNHLENSFNAICEHLERRKTKILKAISDIEGKQLSQIQPWIKEHKEMKDAVSSDVRELEALRDQKDPVLFIKVPTTLPRDIAALGLAFVCTVLILLSKCLFLQGLAAIQAR